MRALGVVGFVVALLVSVMLHEGGHFLTAKRFGMKVTQFFVGFGPTLFSRRRGETEYGIKAVPAGGFVKIIGMTPLEEIEPGDEPRAFYNKPAGQRAVVLAAGSFTHFLIAIALVFASLWLGGKVHSNDPVIQLGQCLTQPCQPGATTPARQAGLLDGDRVLSFAGQPVSTFDQLSSLIRGGRAGQVQVQVQRGNEVLTKQVTLVEAAGPDPKDPSRTVTTPKMGVGPKLSVENLGALGAAGATPGVIGQFVTGTADALAHFPQKISGVFSANRDPTGAAGVVGISRVSGDVLAASDPLSLRIADLLLIVASVNLFVGVFNLLPLLPLDGGHIAILAFEQGRDRLRRMRGYRGQLQRVDLNKLLPATYAVVAIFAVLTLVLASADIVNPIRLR